MQADTNAIVERVELYGGGFVAPQLRDLLTLSAPAGRHRGLVLANQTVEDVDKRGVRILERDDAVEEGFFAFAI